MADAARYLNFFPLAAVARRWRVRIHGALLSALIAICAAGREAQPSAEFPPLRFTVFSAQPIANVAFAPRADAAPQKIVFYPTARSPRYEYRGAMPLRFLDASTGKTLAEANVPSSIRDALLLFSVVEPPTKDGFRYRIAVLDDGAVRHAAGKLLIVNLSGLELSGVIGRHAVVLKSGMNPPLDVSGATQIALRAAFQARTYQSYADQVEIDGHERALLILFPPYYEGSLEAQSRMLIDRPPVSAPAAVSQPDAGEKRR